MTKEETMTRMELLKIRKHLDDRIELAEKCIRYWRVQPTTPAAQSALKAEQSVQAELDAVRTMLRELPN